MHPLFSLIDAGILLSLCSIGINVEFSRVSRPIKGFTLFFRSLMLYFSFAVIHWIEA